MPSDFVHLHNHSHYSLQDAACTIPELIQSAIENDMPALALTDHGVMYGAAEFYGKAKKAGIKPIIGCEAYIVVEGSRLDKGKSTAKDEDEPDTHTSNQSKRMYNHLILLAKNEIGYKNLIKLCSVGHTEGYYYKPRIDMDVLRNHSEGLICTSACPAGIVSVPILNNNYDKAKKISQQFKEIFGDDFYLEIQDHGLEVEKPLLDYIPKIASELDIKLIATNDIHYQKHEHSLAHNVLLNLSSKEANYKDLRYGTDQLYFKSAEEMKKLFGKYKGAIENTLEITEKINLDFKYGVFHTPVFPIPSDSPAKNLDEYFELLAREGLQRRFKTITKEIEDRFNYEIDTIHKMGFSGYFLIVQDFINASKARGIAVGPGRGSAAGSLVAYCLRITNVNPLEYDLLFERFLNPARKSMPDIDVDFADDKREKAIDYVKEKYGSESVCQIVTFNTLSSKAVLTDVARVIGVPLPTVKNITKFIPSVFGKVYSIQKAIDEVPELEWLKNNRDEKLKELIEISKILEGKNRNSSKHAAGVVIAPSDVTNYAPIAKASREDDVYVTQYNMKELEGFAGLLKMDFLGLRTLTILTDAINLIKKTHGIDIDLDEISYSDPKTFELFSNGQTTAVFQFESGPMREHLRNLKPTSVKDLSAMNALYRPGPMEFIDTFIKRKHGLLPVEYIHIALEPILKETYGIIVYQEQVIQLANKVAGMSLADADILRRAMGKKDLKAMAEQKQIFIAGATKNGIPEDIATKIFEDIDKFANYGFNKSHAVAYSVVAYQTAYLKAHYPAEFLAANMTNELKDVSKIAILLDECRKMKVEVLPPNVNKPSVFFDVEDEKIVFGMAAIKGVGEAAVEAIKKAREELGRDFTTIFDFCANVDNRVINKKALESLVLAGAFDFTGYKRSQNFSVIEQAIDFAKRYKASVESNADGLFGETPDTEIIPEPQIPDIAEWPKEQELKQERSVLGFYLTDHPLSKWAVDRRSFSSIELGDTQDVNDDQQVKVVAVVTDVQTKMDKNKNTMAFFKIDDITGTCECLMFSKIYDKCGEHLVEENIILVMGKAENSGDAVKLHIDNIMPIREARYKMTSAIGITINAEFHNLEKLNDVETILKEYPGEMIITINYIDTNGHSRYFKLDNYRVNFCDEFVEKLTNCLGSENIIFVG